MTIQETQLPPGFRFHPTDEELILYYLSNRAVSLPCPVSIIAEVDIYKFNPWELPDKAVYGEKEWYFFSPRDRKYPNGMRPNRAAGSGYWKATGTDKLIVAPPNGNESIGVKKALVFYKGRPPKGMKTSWIMHEYRLTRPPVGAIRPAKTTGESSMRLDDWVLCRIYNKSSNPTPVSGDIIHEEYNPGNAYFSPLETAAASIMLPKCHSFGDLLEDNDYSFLARILCDNAPCHVTVPEADQQLAYENPNESQLGFGSHARVTWAPLQKSTPELDFQASSSGRCLKRERFAAEFDDKADLISCLEKRPGFSRVDYSVMASQYDSVNSPFQFSSQLEDISSHSLYKELHSVYKLPVEVHKFE